MADAEAHGQIFAAPSASYGLEAIKAADGGKGVILLYCNYAGDVMNFNMAQEMAGISISLIKIDEEIKKYYDMAADSPGYVKMAKH